LGDIPIILVGNKSDKERKVDIETAERIATIHRSPYIECSAQKGENIEAVFELLVRELRKKYSKNVDMILPYDDQRPCCCNIF
jgi:GTPase SAR1 family protein